MKNVVTSPGSYRVNFDDDGVAEIILDTRCAGIMLTGLNDLIDTVSVSLISSSLRDKVHYEINQGVLDCVVRKVFGISSVSQTLQIIGQEPVKSDLFIPFALGNLNLGESNKLRIIIRQRKVEGVVTVKSSQLSRVIFANNAKAPITVKLSRGSDFDSAYYKFALLTQNVGLQFFNLAKEKVNFPKNYVQYILERGEEFISLIPNTSYELSEEIDVFLLDY